MELLRSCVRQFRHVRKRIRASTTEWRLRARAATARSGVPRTTFDPKGLIVSLTSYGARLGTAHIAIESLLRQDLEPDAIILWLTADDAASLPPAIERQQRRGLVVRVCPDLRSYKKIVPALEAFPEATIVTADDDLMYPRAWLRELVKCQRAHGDAIPCHRAHRMTFDATAALRPYTDWEFEA